MLDVGTSNQQLLKRVRFTAGGVLPRITDGSIMRLSMSLIRAVNGAGQISCRYGLKVRAEKARPAHGATRYRDEFAPLTMMWGTAAVTLFDLAPALPAVSSRRKCHLPTFLWFTGYWDR